MNSTHMKKTTIIAFAAAALTACAAQGNKTAASAEAGKAEKPQTSEVRLVGGYTAQRPLDEREKELFESVTAGLTGVRYTPQSVATQVVAGTNYRFVCTAVTATREPQSYKAEVTVFQPLPGQGEARITAIERL